MPWSLWAGRLEAGGLEAGIDERPKSSIEKRKRSLIFPVTAAEFYNCRFLVKNCTKIKGEIYLITYYITYE